LQGIFQKLKQKVANIIANCLRI